MNRPKTEKRFDSVECKRKVQEEMYEEIKDLSTAEQIEYVRRRAEQGPLGDWWRRVQEQRARPTHTSA
jgi:uncharacterized coiled-coil protein SlyX